jgi:hypothetical protein
MVMTDTQRKLERARLFAVAREVERVARDVDSLATVSAPEAAIAYGIKADAGKLRDLADRLEAIA